MVTRENLVQRLDKYSRPFVITVGVLCVLLIGSADYLSGSQISLSVFYLLPVTLATWLADRRTGVWISVACAMTWLAADLLNGIDYSHWIIPYWNAGMRLGVFITVSLLLSALKELSEKLELRVTEKTKSLSEELAERKRTERLLRDQATLIDRARDAILIFDLDQRILFWNKGAERLYGWSGEMTEGKHLIEFPYQVGEKERLEEARATVLKEGEWGGLLHQITKNKKEIIVESSWTLMRDEEGIPTSILSVSSDVTETKRLESQMLRLQRMESIGTLASGIAHDLNNILAPISLGIGYLMQRMEDQHDCRILRTLEASAARGSDMVKHIVTFAKGWSGERVVIQSKQVLREIEEIVHQTFPKSIEFKLEVEEELWDFRGDPTQLHQLILNLCLNARDAMPQGGNLNVFARNTEIDEQFARMDPSTQPGKFVFLQVSDSGEGIPHDIVESIFEPFFTTKEPGKGSGLGLPNVQAIVKNHGGFIKIYSQPGRGTSFKVYLPALVQVRPLEERRELPALPYGHKELILVVDDEAAVRDITKQTLETFGYNVLVAADGTEAVTLFSSHRHEIQLVVTDMVMPLMDGWATIRTLRRIEPDVKVIVTSGLGEHERLADQENVQAFLTKPYNTESLLNAVDAVLHVDSAGAKENDPNVMESLE